MIPVYLGKLVFGKGSNTPPEAPDNGIYGIDPYQTPDKTPVKR